MADGRCPVRACMAQVGPMNWWLCDRHWLALPIRARELIEDTIRSMYETGGREPGQAYYDNLMARALAKAYELTDAPSLPEWQEWEACLTLADSMVDTVTDNGDGSFTHTLKSRST